MPFLCDYMLLSPKGCKIQCREPCDGPVSFECCLHVLTNVKLFVPTEGSERLHKEEASDEDEDTEYFDAMEDSPAFITVTATDNTQHRSVTHTDPPCFN